jgi:hypothetical protein
MFPKKIFYGADAKRRKYLDILSDPDDLHRAEERCFLNTATETVRHNPLCPVTIKPVVLDNFRE